MFGVENWIGSHDQYISPMFILKLFGFPNTLNNKLKSLKLIDSSPWIAKIVFILCLIVKKQKLRLLSCNQISFHHKWEITEQIALILHSINSWLISLTYELEQQNKSSLIFLELRANFKLLYNQNYKHEHAFFSFLASSCFFFFVSNLGAFVY